VGASKRGTVPRDRLSCTPNWEVSSTTGWPQLLQDVSAALSVHRYHEAFLVLSRQIRSDR